MYLTIKTILLEDYDKDIKTLYMVNPDLATKLDINFHRIQEGHFEAISIRSTQHKQRLVVLSASLKNQTCVQVDFFDNATRSRYSNFHHFDTKEEFMEVVKDFLFYGKPTFGCIEKPI